MLDSDSDGMISAQMINLEALPIEILELLSPLMQEIDNFNEQLDREEFIESALCLY
jgi:hypothetical protein